MTDQSPMKIAYFSNQFADAKGHGIARYARELRAGFAGLEGLEVTPVAAWTNFDQAGLAKLRQDTGLITLPTGRNLTKLGWTFAGFPRLEMIAGQSFDLVHALSLGYPIATGLPYVVTIHDLGPLTQPQFFGNAPAWVMQRALNQAVRKAAMIICVSHSTAREVIEYCGSAVEDRVRIVGEGVSPEFFAPGDQTLLEGFDLPPAEVPFILAAGKISPRKNIHGVLEAVRLLEGLPHHLVLVGAGGWDMAEVSALLSDPAVQGRVHLLGFVSDAQLRALYARAAIYVHPSLYEGFGLTILEAMAGGVPVITSDRSSLPEVAGDAAVLVDPTKPEEIAAAITRIANDPAFAQELSAKGVVHARDFRWADAARELRGCYREILGR